MRASYSNRRDQRAVPMLATSITEWPEGRGWALEPKYDGYRLIVQIKPCGRVCAWSRHGTSLIEPLRELLGPFGAVGAGWVIAAGSGVPRGLFRV